MTELELIEILKSLKRAQGAGARSGQQAPHKPLLLLALLAMVERGEERNSFGFKAVKTEFDKLWAKYGWTGRGTKAAYPFWYLRSDGLWQLRDENGTLPAGGAPPPDGAFDTRGIEGRFTRDAWELLGDQTARRAAIDLLVQSYFPSRVQDELRGDLGLDWSPEPAGEQPPAAARKGRNPAEQNRFREALRDAYEGRCAVCGFGPRDARAPSAIEAAHIWPVEYGGPTEPENGVAMCPIHHWALDSGALTFEDSGRILVSAKVKDGETIDQYLRRYAGQQVRAPLRCYPSPSPKWIKLHRENRFLRPEL